MLSQAILSTIADIRMVNLMVYRQEIAIDNILVGKGKFGFAVVLGSFASLNPADVSDDRTINLHSIGLWCNGSTEGFDPFSLSSILSKPANY